MKTYIFGEKKHKPLQEGQGIYIVATTALVVGLLLAVICNLTNFSFSLYYPCMLKEVVHIYCPGCGGTRAFLALLHLHIKESFLCNPIVLYLAFLFLYYYIGTTLAVLCKGRRIFFRPRKWMLIVGVVIMVVNTVARNYLAIVQHIDYLGDIWYYW